MKTAVKNVHTQEAIAIVLPKLAIRQIDLTISSDSPLIVHNWGDKARKMMLDKQMKRAKTAREAKNPDDDFNSSRYLNDDGKDSFPAVGLKSAAVDACSHVAGVTKVQARGAFHIVGDLIEIQGEASPREDMVRVGMGTADIRYRAEYRDWKMKFRIRYNENVLSAEQIVNLFNTAGFAIGIGEWRPEKNGSFGMFHVAQV